MVTMLVLIGVTILHIDRSPLKRPAGITTLPACLRDLRSATVTSNYGRCNGCLDYGPYGRLTGGLGSAMGRFGKCHRQFGKAPLLMLGARYLTWPLANTANMCSTNLFTNPLTNLSTNPLTNLSH